MLFFFILKERGIYESIFLESRYKMCLYVWFVYYCLRDCLPGTLDPQALLHKVLKKKGRHLVI